MLHHSKQRKLFCFIIGAPLTQRQADLLAETA
jgi:hypothetical protein